MTAIDPWWMYLVGPGILITLVMSGFALTNYLTKLAKAKLPKHYINALDDITKRSKD